MSRFIKLMTCAALSLSLIGVSTTAAASAPAPTEQPDPWAILSLASGGASAAAVCGAAAAAATAAQPMGGCVLPQVGVVPAVSENVLPPPPPPVAYTGLSTPPIAVLLVWAAVLGTMVYILTQNHHRSTPNSPA